MTNLPKNLPDLLRAAGLKVVTIDGWETRGRPRSTGSFAPVGVLNHHTGSYDGAGDAAQDLAYAKWMFLTGRSDLPAPLCHLSISAEGVVYLGAAGRANHAGKAKPSGSVAGGDGNSLYIGIEWMLSGKQPIPDAMMKAGVLLNAVLCKEVTHSSVQTISCHYQTSVTGKWDIGDPNGIRFGSNRVLDVPAFRERVQDTLNRLNKTTAPNQKNAVLVRPMHVSMQFSDTPEQMKSDAERVFALANKRNVSWITGTEAGNGADPLGRLLVEAGRRAGFRMWVPSVRGKGRGQHTASWLAVRQDLIDSGWSKGYVPVIPSSTAVYEERGLNPKGRARWAPRGIVHASFTNQTLGRIHIGSSHYLTKGRPGAAPALRVNVDLNRRLAEAIGEWARQKGKGPALVFYGGDQNIVDRTTDTFFGSPLTSVWDETKHWPDTGHGNIDLIASFNGNGRVRAVKGVALNDKAWHLHTDHFPIIADYQVKPVRQQ